MTYEPHDPEGDEWTCTRCGAVIASLDHTTVHTMFHDTVDAMPPLLEALSAAVVACNEVLDALRPTR